MYISLWENYRGHPDNISFMQFSTKIDGFEQKDSQGFENSYNSYEQYPLEKFLIFTIYQNYTLALNSVNTLLALNWQYLQLHVSLNPNSAKHCTQHSLTTQPLQTNTVKKNYNVAFEFVWLLHDNTLILGMFHKDVKCTYSRA